MAAETYEPEYQPAPQVTEVAPKPAVRDELASTVLLSTLDKLKGATWHDLALCAETDPEIFFPEKGGSTREAKKVCGKCEVQDECLRDALKNDERFGLWGGLSERERRQLQKKPPESNSEPMITEAEVSDSSPPAPEEHPVIYTRSGMTLLTAQPGPDAAATEHLGLPLVPLSTKSRIAWQPAPVREARKSPIIIPEIPIALIVEEPKEKAEPLAIKRDRPARNTEAVSPGRIEYRMGDGVWHMTERQLGVVALLYDEQGLERMSIDEVSQHLRQQPGYVRRALREVIGSFS